MTYRADMPQSEQIARRKAARKKWYEANKDEIIARQRAYQESLPKEQRRQYTRAWAAKNVESERLRARAKNWRKLGFNEPPPRPIPDACECCGKPCVKTLSLDHCHETGTFRGWLCSRCNLGIGKLGDTVEAVEKALLYLKRAKQ